MPVTRRRAPAAPLMALATHVLLACGSRAEPTQIVLPPQLDAGGPAIECLVDEDCEPVDLCRPQHCLEERCVEQPIDCRDDDPCTQDGCDSATGRCRFEPLTADDDSDGYHRPLPGYLPGDPAACGTDCNDASPVAHPGGVELCDGVDNDCDGSTDNGALFSPSNTPALVLSEGAEQGSPGGLTFSDRSGVYGAVFTQRFDSSQNTFKSVQPRKAGTGAAVAVAEVNSDTFAGPIVGRGAVLATAWEDRRDDDYEIYFNRLNARGDKLGPDLRVTRAPGFSLRPTLVELATATAREYRLAWEDERGGGLGGIYGQSLDAAGSPIGGNVELTPAGLDPSSPSLAFGTARLGLLFNMAVEGGRALGFRSFDLSFGDGSDVVPIRADSPDAATLTANAGRFVVAWHLVLPDSRPGTQIWGSVLAENGDELIAPRPLTEAAAFARYHSLVPLGDRFMLFWSEWRDGHYAIYSNELTPELEPLGLARRVTAAGEEGFAPLAAFGPQGELGVLFTGRSSSGQPQALFTSVSCDPGADISLPR